jgi:hypothetical protein
MNILLKFLTITLTLVAGLQAMDDQCPVEIKQKILTEVVKDNYVKLDFINFIESVRPLRTVCKQWGNIISNDFMHDAMVLGCQQTCPEFLNGKLIFRPKQGSDEGMIVLKILDLWNPQAGTLNLSECKIEILDNKGRIKLVNVSDFLSISTGYRKGKKAENNNKLEVWLTLRDLVAKELETTAGHLKAIFPSKWPESAKVGMLWTCGAWDRMNSYDYLTTENMDDLSKINLFENWKKAWLSVLAPCVACAERRRSWVVGGGLEGSFHVLFVN